MSKGESSEHAQAGNPPIPSTTYPVPEALRCLATEAVALERLRDRYVKRPWGYRAARRASLEAAQKCQTFWDNIRILYPELTGKALRYVDGVVGTTIHACPRCAARVLGSCVPCAILSRFMGGDDIETLAHDYEPAETHGDALQAVEQALREAIPYYRETGHATEEPNDV